jgi:hypothetical protein
VKCGQNIINKFCFTDMLYMKGYRMVQCQKIIRPYVMTHSRQLIDLRKADNSIKLSVICLTCRIQFTGNYLKTI